MVYPEHLEHLGSLTLILSGQESGQGASERLHNDEKCIRTKTRNSLGDKVKQQMTEVKMSMILKRSDLSNQNETYQGTERVTVLGLVCEKMVDRVGLARHEEEDRQEREVVVLVVTSVLPAVDGSLSSGST